MWLAGAQTLGLSVLFLWHCQGAGFEVEYGHELVPILDASIVDATFTCYATVLAPQNI